MMSQKLSLAGGVLSLLVTLVLAGCATGPNASSPDKIRRALALNTDTSVERYVLGPTDVVKVSVWRNPELSITVPVRPDGMISVPLIGDVAAGNKTPELLAYDIKGGLSQYIREPQVSVVVTAMGSHEFTDRVRVTGAVQSPISVPHRSGMTVLDLFLSAGAANAFASLNDAMLYRPMGDEVVAIPVRLEDILERGDIKTNYAMRPGDILSVPERSF
ncbi:XrtA/PEP-CTERM system exopolysaccharide export protein [Marinobacter mobilis]|uniref:Polysaccharide export outer membrane protein n=1 Tax=Marinobacter mobilis TaxID=488533 RepID=A0A1H2UVM1_9GAMM|nr:XrtA/PEP-CTERM system exopolysaccharide export protein [Marinobacter mobilis]SDW59639.1 polysaccharide export outer membrane protein [Marinobacter mobilis]